MTDEDIIKLAIEHTVSGLKFDEEGLVRFANLIASAEREACAKVADGWPDYDVQGLAETIRERGKP